MLVGDQPDSSPLPGMVLGSTAHGNKTLQKGLYETLISEALAAALGGLSVDGFQHIEAKVDASEVPRRVGAFVSNWVAQALESVPQRDRADVARALSHRLATVLTAEGLTQDPGQLRLVSGPTDLRAVFDVGSAAPGNPRIPLTDSTLLTNARGEPSIGNELETEIESADRIDLVLAFIRWSGIRRLKESLAQFCQRGGELRVLTTIYTGSTEARALDELEALGAQVKISYDRSATRLHAKAWLFHRASGFSTVYIGSSNLTYSAQVSGIEWNVRASESVNTGLIDKFNATFESYWASAQFEHYDEDVFLKAIAQERGGDSVDFTPFDLHPYPFQARMLEQITLARQRGHHANLLVAATGTGKTVIAALDYRSLCSDGAFPRLLFVAHRDEILRQSRTVFRHVLRRGDFGEMQVGGHSPADSQHVFASVQSMHAHALERFDPSHFDVIIVDEFHHAAANTYERLLKQFAPRELLGLTATPERMDGGDILHFFDGRIAAELRLWDALEQQLLCPFHYFGIADESDLSRVKWQAGSYNSAELTNVYTADHAWVGKVLQATKETVTDIGRMKAIGFCVSIKHAEFMAERFGLAGLKAKAITSRTASTERSEFKDQLQRGELNILFTVDLFNEGVDIPSVDTILMLRPTASATVFLQQLGRGLRRSEGKDVLTVLDFVGQHRKEFRFYQRFEVMTGGSRVDVERSLTSGFASLPAGCEITLDRQASENVLANLRASIPNNVSQRASELAALGDVSLAEYLSATGLDLADLYAGKNYWTALRRRAGFSGEAVDVDVEARLGRGIARLLHVDDEVQIDWLLSVLAQDTPPPLQTLAVESIRRLNMLLVPLLSPRKGELALSRALELIWDAPPLRDELVQMLNVRRECIDHLHRGQPVVDVPLFTHAYYARDEVLAAYGVSTVEEPLPLQAGVYWDEVSKTNLLFVTLDKSDSTFSPTTRYRDYAISERLFHWESQGGTSDTSPTGLRYIEQRSNGTRVALFCREKRRQSNGATAPYLFLGLADYVRHEGSQPIALTWHLHEDIPGDAFVTFRAAVA